MSPVCGRAVLSSSGESYQRRGRRRDFRHSVVTDSCKGPRARVVCQQALLVSSCYWLVQTDRVPCPLLSKAVCNGGVDTGFAVTWPWIQTWLRQVPTHLMLEVTPSFKVWVFLHLGKKKSLFTSSWISHCLEHCKYSRLYFLLLFDYFCQGLDFLGHKPSAMKSHRLPGLWMNE